MELRNIFKAAPLALIVVGITMLATNSNQPATTITILTSEEEEYEIPKDIAFESSMIKEMAGDVGESNMLIIPITGRSLSLIVSILQAIKAAPNATKLKREDGQYIAQRIQPLIDQALAAADNQAIAHVIHTAEFLDLEQIANGAIRVLIQKALAQNPSITLDTIENTWFNEVTWPNRLNHKFEYQYKLVSNGNIPELSLKDYIAINGMPTVSNRFSLDQNITSLEGLDSIPNIASVESFTARAKLCSLPKDIFTAVPEITRLNLSENFLQTLPEDVFKPLVNLVVLLLEKNKLISLPEKVFYPLINIQEINLGYNQLSDLPTNLRDNPITQRMTQAQFIAAHPNSENMSSILW